MRYFGNNFSKIAQCWGSSLLAPLILR